MRVIQVGVGGFGKSWRLALTTSPDVEVAALVDISGDNLREAGEALGIPSTRWFSSDHLPWEEVEADAVIHSAPQNVRYQHVMRALAAGKHVLMVKPLSDRLETAIEMVEDAERRGRKLVVAQQMRWHPLILKLRQLVQSGTLGEVGYVHLDFFFPKHGYAGSYAQPYPLLVQGSIHHFDLVRWVLDCDARRVWAENWNPSWITGHGIRAGYAAVEMESGVRVLYRSVPTQSDHHSWLCDWRLEGTKGLATLTNGVVRVNGDEVLALPEDLPAFNARLPELQQEVFRQFAAYLAGREEPTITGRRNLNSLAVSFGAIKAGETGRRQEIGA
ncbi:MAG TPA: Gfo/Idh/MocA family oxidoreductase [Armatimonadota bacterium]|jgi:predicted dehydrogenase